jgi:hypothetical protein
MWNKTEQPVKEITRTFVKNTPINIGNKTSGKFWRDAQIWKRAANPFEVPIHGIDGHSDGVGYRRDKEIEFEFVHQYP